MYKKSCFRKPLISQRVNDFQNLNKSIEESFHVTFSSLWVKLSGKKLFVVKSEAVVLLVNTWNATLVSHTTKSVTDLR